MGAGFLKAVPARPVVIQVQHGVITKRPY